MKLVWNEAALDDISLQLDYVAEDNPSAAARLESEIERQADLLIDHPEIGRPGRVGGTRELVIDRTPYVLIYRIREDRVEILKLLHGAQRWPPRRSVRAV